MEGLSVVVVAGKDVDRNVKRVTQIAHLLILGVIRMIRKVARYQKRVCRRLRTPKGLDCGFQTGDRITFRGPSGTDVRITELS